MLDQRRYLLTCSLSEGQVRRDYPALWAYLEQGKERGIDQRYLCAHRSPWYAQELRRPAPLLCTYMGRHTERGGPFRFILNHSQAIAPNVYLMLYPKRVLRNVLALKPELLPSLRQALAEISSEILVETGRVYGGGLHKLEPRELGNAPADQVLAITGIPAKSEAPQQLSLWNGN